MYCISLRGRDSVKPWSAEVPKSSAQDNQPGDNLYPNYIDIIGTLCVTPFECM